MGHNQQPPAAPIVDTVTVDTGICEKDLKVIKNEAESASGNFTAKQKLQGAQEEVKNYKLCSLATAEESSSLYQNILSFVTLENLKKAKIITKDVDTLIARDNEIGKLIASSSKNIKTLSDKLKHSVSKADETLSLLENIINKPEDRMNNNEKTIVRQVKKVIEKVKGMNDKAYKAFKGSITIAGLQTYTNTPSLKPLATELDAKLIEFKSNIDQNIASTSKDVETHRKALNSIVEEFTAAVYDTNSAKTEELGLKAIKDFLCSEEVSTTITDPETFNCTFAETSGEANANQSGTNPPAPEVQSTNTKTRSAKTSSKK